MTRNTGKFGTFVETGLLPPFDAALKLRITLSSGGDQGFETPFCGSGVVCHVTRGDKESAGFGAKVRFHTKRPTRAG